MNPALKTILHIPHVASRESTKRGKDTEVSEILEALGTWKGKDPKTGFDLVQTADGRVLKIADLVDDGPDRHAKVLAALKDPTQKNNRDHVDIIIALGMAKEGFDWIWCEHALTVGYRSSLTEIIQIIGRATRNVPGKTRTPNKRQFIIAMGLSLKNYRPQNISPVFFKNFPVNRGRNS